MNRAQLVAEIKKKKSVLCVGLDTDLTKIPKHLLSEEDPSFAFNKAIIDATKDYTVAYKINTAFYEAQGLKGWISLQKTLEYIPKDIFTIADAKRGDIGNTAEQYAITFFKTYPFDSVTVAPYMGKDSVQPFMQFDGHWAIVLGLTSNAGSADFQLQPSGDEMMYEHFFLIPGVGAQGGDVPTVCENSLNKDGGILINVSRAVIYASTGEDFAAKAEAAAKDYQQQMAAYL
jgi:orotidine-5'-phosphate decarboxylase